MFEAIPAELKNLPQWVTASADKQPMQLNGYPASVTDDRTWATFNSVVEAHANGAQPFIGFVFSKRDKYTGIDLDATDDEAIKVIQQAVYDNFPSYAELSQSEKGLHIIVEGNVPHGRRRKSVEVYSDSRYFVMTGKVYRAAPIVNCQPQLDALYAEMARGNIASNATGDAPQKEEDRAIYDRAMNAANGDKFNSLWQGDWQGLHYPSQSEADFALVDILAFYSPNDEQVTRMFRASALGARLKALRQDYINYMLKRCRDRQPDVIDLEGVEIAAQIARETIAKRVAVPLAAPTISIEASIPSKVKPPFKLPANPYTPPPGLMGELAQYIHSQAARPVPEIALAGAIGFMAGVCGRAYNHSNQGTNLYMLVLASSGVGKEAMASGIDNLMQAIEPDCLTVHEFRGPGAIASGPALIKALSKTPSFVSVLGEFSYKFQSMAMNNPGSADASLSQIMSDIYHKSGYSAKFQKSVYSQNEKNVEAIQSPALTILAETVPEAFYSVVDRRVIINGLLPRFIIIDCQHVERAKLNKYAGHAPPEELRQKCLSLVNYSQLLNVNNKRACINVKANPEAELLLEQIGDYIDGLMKGVKDEVIRNLWNRAQINIGRLASLVAIGCNQLDPTMTRENVEWAGGIVFHTTQMLLSRFNAGEIGSDSDDSAAQMRVFKEACAKYMHAKSHHELLTYRVNSKMFEKGIVPISIFQMWCQSRTPFKNDKAGARNAFAAMVKTMMDHGYISEVLDRKVNDAVEANGGRIFHLNKPEQWL